MRVFAWVGFCVVLVGCGNSCRGCGSDPEQAPARPISERAPAVIEPDGGVRGVEQVELGPHYAPRSEGPELVALEQAKRALTEPRAPRPTLIPAKELSSKLPNKLGAFAAEAPASVGPGAALGQAITGVKRVYKHASETAVVKLTDAGQSPGLLFPVAQRLTFEGGAAVGAERGVLIGTTPAIESFYPEHAHSRLMAVVDRHLLVEIRVTDTQDAGAARSLFEALALP